MTSQGMYSIVVGGSWNKVLVLPALVRSASVGRSMESESRTVQYCSKLKQLFCTSYTCINSSTTVQQYCIYCTVLWSLIQLLFCIHNAEKADAEQGAPRKKRPLARWHLWMKKQRLYCIILVTVFYYTVLAICIQVLKQRLYCIMLFMSQEKSCSHRKRVLYYDMPS